MTEVRVRVIAVIENSGIWPIDNWFQCNGEEKERGTDVSAGELQRIKIEAAGGAKGGSYRVTVKTAVARRPFERRWGHSEGVALKIREIRSSRNGQSRVI